MKLKFSLNKRHSKKDKKVIFWYIQIPLLKLDPAKILGRLTSGLVKGLGSSLPFHGPALSYDVNYQSQMTLMECLRKLNVTALSGGGPSDKQKARHNHSSEELPVWCLTDKIFYQDSFPIRLIFLTWFSLSLSISVFIWQCANAVAESEDSFSLCIYIENLCLLVVLFLVWFVR